MMQKLEAKIVLLGSASAGKTCLLDRFLHGTFHTSTTATIAGSFAAKTIETDDAKVVLKCWDTAGSERYMSVSRMYYRNAVAAILCYDLTDKCSYDRTRTWVTELRSTEEDCKLYVCGTKKDLIDKNPSARAVPEDTASIYAKDLLAEYFETSSKTGENVDELFKQIAQDSVSLSQKLAEEKMFKQNDIENSIKVSWRKDHRVKATKKSCCTK